MQIHIIHSIRHWYRGLFVKGILAITGSYIITKEIIKGVRLMKNSDDIFKKKRLFLKVSLIFGFICGIICGIILLVDRGYCNNIYNKVLENLQLEGNADRLFNIFEEIVIIVNENSSRDSIVFVYAVILIIMLIIINNKIPCVNKNIKETICLSIITFIVGVLLVYFMPNWLVIIAILYIIPVVITYYLSCIISLFLVKFMYATFEIIIGVTGDAVIDMSSFDASSIDFNNILQFTSIFLTVCILPLIWMITSKVLSALVKISSNKYLGDKSYKVLKKFTSYKMARLMVYLLGLYAYIR